MITRHFEPEHNVKPFLGGAFHAVSGEPPAFTDEGMTGGNEGMMESNEGKSWEGETGTDVKKVWGNEKEHVLQSVEKIVKREGKELKNEKNGLEEDKTVPGTYEGRFAEGNKDPLPGVWKIGKGVERVVEGEARIPAGETTRLGSDDIAVKGVPLLQDKVRTEVETKIKYMTREVPVLQDPGGNEQAVQQARGQRRTAMNVSGFVKDNPPVKQAIHVSIGRIEIKATLPPAEIKAAPVKKDKDIMGLDQYLEQRNPAKQ